jgi:tetratricopeptide (TPR) repeat protein
MDPETSAEERRLREALKQAELDQDHRLAAECLLGLATLFLQAENYERAVDLTRGAVARARESGDPTLLAIARTQAGLAHEFNGDFPEAIRWLEEAAEAGESLDENQHLHLDQARGRVWLRLQEVEKGLALTQDVIDARSRRQEYELAALTALNAGTLLLELDKERAAQWLQRWRDVCNAAGPDYELERQRILLSLLGLG